GYVTLGLGIANEAALTGSLAHLVNHGVTKSALFLLVGGIVLRGGDASFASLAGLGQRMPWTSFGIVVAGLSLIGVPATAGFTSKWYLIAGAAEQGSWWIVALVVAGSLIAVAYVWRFVEAAYLAQPPAGAAAGEPPLSMRASEAVAVALCVVLGLVTAFNIGFARRAVGLLLGGAG
ncbi:MAG: proton-conducting transporter membrane subunit, partial [Betaproteobacteria bacterium]|nr:proton-conducting transporter membrane subunit [Betaproteobacteria bacterium]